MPFCRFNSLIWFILSFYTMAAKQAGASLNEFIIAAIEEKIERDSPEIYAQMQEETKD